MVRHGFLLSGTTTTTMTILMVWHALILLATQYHPTSTDAFVVVPVATTSTATTYNYNQWIETRQRPSTLKLQALPFSTTTLEQLSSISISGTTITTLSTSSTAVASSIPSSSMQLAAAATIDPTTFLQDVLGGVLGTPLILAIPIVAALGVASLIAFLIVAYANPAESED